MLINADKKKGVKDSPPLSIPLRKSLFLLCSFLFGGFFLSLLLCSLFLCHNYRLLSLGIERRGPNTSLTCKIEILLNDISNFRSHTKKLKQSLSGHEIQRTLFASKSYNTRNRLSLPLAY